MRTHSLRADLLMLLVALIWGFSFLVQRQSLATIGPLLFTGVRFLLGTAVIALMGLWRRKPANAPAAGGVAAARPWGAGALLGVLVALSLAAQQIGLGYTKVANAGFISSMYVVIVPLLSILAGQRLRGGIVIGALCAALGLYFLGGEHLKLTWGDGVELFGAVVMSLQIMLMGTFTQRHDPLTLAWIQDLVCAITCLAAASLTEPLRLHDITHSMPAILYSGGLSVGLAYGLQAIAQRDAVPSHAVIIFSMEGVVAALAARVLLDERLSWHAILGCALVVLGCLFSQLAPLLRRRSGRNQASSPISGRNEQSW